MKKNEMLDLPKIENKICESYSEAIDIMNGDYKFKTISTHANVCSINDDLDICIHDIPKFKTSFEGMERLTKILKIPFNFSVNIPKDLLIENVNRLLQEKRDNNIDFLVSEKNNYLVDAGIKKHNLISFDKIQEILSKHEFNPLEDIWISENGLNFKSVSEKITATPKVGNLTQFGLNLNYNWVLNTIPKIQACSYTLVCSNGAIYPTKTGKIFNKDDDFYYDLQHFLKSSQSTIAKLDKADTQLLNLNDFRNSYSFVKSVAGEFSANNALDTNKDVIKLISKNIKNIEEIHNATNPMGEIIYPDWDKTIYDAFSGITKIAHTTGLDRGSQLKLELFSGRLIENINLN